MEKSSFQTMSLSEFYSDLPKLQNKYQQRIDTNAEFCEKMKFDNKDVSTRSIIAFAKRECIDSVVNLNALKCVQTDTEITVSVVTSGDVMEKYIDSRSTPLILGLNKESEVIWEWERAPVEVKMIEASKDHSIVIIEKMAYRRGKYIPSTLQEIMKLIQTKNSNMKM